VLKGGSDAAISFQARVSKNGTCSSKVSSSVCSVDSLVTPALFCMLPQATSQPGISSIQEPTHVMAMLSFALNCGTLEDVDMTIIDMFDMGNRGEEHIDG
jgi:hypothetical protein